MLNIKKTINFKTIRDQGPKSIDIQGDEVVQIVSSHKQELLCVVTQEFLMSLIASYNYSLVHAGVKKEEVINIDFNEKIKEMEKDIKKLLKIAKEDEKAFKVEKKK